MGFRVVMAVETAQNVPLMGFFELQSGDGCRNKPKFYKSKILVCDSLFNDKQPQILQQQKLVVRLVIAIILLFSQTILYYIILFTLLFVTGLLGYRAAMAAETSQNVPLKGFFGLQSGDGCRNNPKCASD